MTTIVAPPSNASKWQMGFNSAFKGLKYKVHHSVTYIVTDPTAVGLDLLPYCLPEDTSELGTGSGLLSEETAGLSVGDDC
jgi:hypothetical protein